MIFVIGWVGSREWRFLFLLMIAQAPLLNVAWYFYLTLVTMETLRTGVHLIMIRACEQFP